MARLVDDSRYKKWYAKICDKNGKEHFRSTGVPKQTLNSPTDSQQDIKDDRERNKRLALEVAIKMEQAEKGEIAGEDVEIAIRSAANRAAANASTMSIATFAATWIWEQGWSHNLIMPSMYAKCDILDQFLSHLKSPTTTSLGNVTHKEVKAFMNTLRDAGLSATRRNSILEIIRSLFNSAVDQGFITSNPAHKIRRCKETVIKRLAFSVQEISAILKVLDNMGEIGHEWRTAILCAVYLGLRGSDAFCLKRNYFKLKEGGERIVFEPKKTRREEIEVDAPLHSTLLNHLRPLLAVLGDDDFLCPTLAHRNRGGRLRKFASILRMAGIDPRVTKRHNRLLPFSRKTFHSFRVSLITWCRLLNMPHGLSMAITGHSDLQTHLDYDASAEDFAIFKAAMEKLPSIPTDGSVKDFSEPTVDSVESLKTIIAALKTENEALRASLNSKQV